MRALFLPVNRISVVLIALLAGALPAARAQQELTDPEAAALRGVVAILEGALRDQLGESLESALGSSSLGPNYESGTLREAIEKLTRMIAEKRIRKADLGGGAQTRPADGTDADRIDLDTGLIAQLLSGSRVEKMKAKLQLACSLANEMTHVYQEPSFLILDRCRAERDSDTASILAAQGLVDALTNGSGGPHLSVAAITIDPARNFALADCMARLGFGTTAEFTAVWEFAKELRDRYTRRRSNFFDAVLATPGDSWVDYYENGGDRSRRNDVAPPTPGRGGCTMTGKDGVSTQNYQLPPGELFVQSLVVEGDDGVAGLILVGHQAGNGFRMHFHRDMNGDGLPEPTGATTLVPSLSPDPGSRGIGLFETSFPGLGYSVLIHDFAAGAIWLQDLDPQALPLGSPQLLVSDSRLAQASGAIHCVARLDGDVQGVRYLFAAAPAPALPQLPVIELRAQNLGNVQVLGPGATVGQLELPLADPSFIGNGSAPGIDSPGLLMLTGQPSGSTSLTFRPTLAIPPLVAPIFPWGESNPLPFLPPPALVGPELVLLQSGALQSTRLVLPGGGEALDHLDVDENGDGANDRVQIVAGPPRLLFMAGDPLQPSSPFVTFLQEQLLETAWPIALDLPWTPVSRGYLALDGPRSLFRLPGSNPPTYAGSIVDLDGDGIANETVVVRRPSGQPAWQLQVLFNVQFAPVPVFQSILPLSFAPESFTLSDLDADGKLDVSLRPIELGSPLHFLNLGFGAFTGTTDSYPGSFEDLILDLHVDGVAAPAVDLVLVEPTESLKIEVFSPYGTWYGEDCYVLGQAFTTGTGLITPAGFPEFQLSFLAPDPIFLVFGSDLGSPLGAGGLLGPAGLGETFLIPPPMTPGLSLMLQAIVPSPVAQNGFFAASSGVELRFD